MARKRPQYKLACVGVSDGDRNVLISAINSFASALEGEFTWVEPGQADIHIVDIANSDNPTEHPVVVRYTNRKNGQPVDLWRPIRAQVLIDTLNAAGERADAQLAGSPVASARRYRGAIVDDAPAPRDNKDTDSKPRRGVIYRGHRIE